MNDGIIMKGTFDVSEMHVADAIASIAMSIRKKRSHFCGPLGVDCNRVGRILRGADYNGV